MAKHSVYNDGLKSHAILGRGGCLLGIALTKSIAECYAKNTYKEGSYSIVVATDKHYEELKDSK